MMQDKPVLIIGDDQFVAKHLKETAPQLEAEGRTVQPVAVISDSQYRAALRDEDTPEGVKKAIRQYFKKKQVEETTSTAGQVFFAGHGVPLRTSREFDKPKDMSARQFKRMKKSRFREWRHDAKKQLSSPTTA